MSLKKYLAAFSASIALLSGAANGATVAFNFTGTVTYGGPMAVAAGAEIRGTFSYDTKTEPSLTYEGHADYQIPSPFAISVMVGSHKLQASNLNVGVWDHFQGNVEDMVQITGSPAVVDGTTFDQGSISIVLASAPGNDRAVKSTALPRKLKLKKFNAGPTLTYGTIQSDGGSNGTLLQFTIDSIVER